MSARLVPGCGLCDDAGGVRVAQGDRLRVVRAARPEEAAFPAFYRVVWHDHVAEFSELAGADRHFCMDVVTAVEQVLRLRLPAGLTPRKINIASLGNMTPHVHWHVIARYGWDSHFPAPIWGTAARPCDEARLAQLRAALPALDAQVAAGVAALGLRAPATA